MDQQRQLRDFIEIIDRLHREGVADDDPHIVMLEDIAINFRHAKDPEEIDRLDNEFWFLAADAFNEHVADEMTGEIHIFDGVEGDLHGGRKMQEKKQILNVQLSTKTVVVGIVTIAAVQIAGGVLAIYSKKATNWLRAKTAEMKAQSL